MRSKFNRWRASVQVDLIQLIQSNFKFPNCSSTIIRCIAFICVQLIHFVSVWNSIQPERPLVIVACMWNSTNTCVCCDSFRLGKKNHIKFVIWQIATDLKFHSRLADFSSSCTKVSLTLKLNYLTCSKIKLSYNIQIYSIFIFFIVCLDGMEFPLNFIKRQSYLNLKDSAETTLRARDDGGRSRSSKWAASL